MRLLFVNEYFPPVAPGGAEWSIYYLAEALAQRGHEVAIATISHGHSLDLPAGVQSYVMPFPLKLAKGQTMHRQGVLENPWMHAAFSSWLGRVAKRFRPDLLHAQSKNSLVATTLLSKWTGIPLVYTLRDIGITCPFGMCFINGRDIERCSFATCMGSCSGHLIEHYSQKRLWDRIKIRALAIALYPDTKLKQWALRHTTQAIAPSRGLLASLPKRVTQGASWNIVPHLPPPARVPENGSTAPAEQLDQPFVLYLGKISPGKGIPVLMDAARAIANEFPKVEFVLAGKGRWDPPKDLRVRNLGSIDHRQALALMRQSACVVVPSVVPEAYNRVVLEAMSQGCAVIASDAGSLGEQVRDGETGYVVPRGSAPALADALRRLLADPDAQKRFGDNGRRLAEQTLSPSQVLPMVEAVYQKSVEATGSVRWRWLNGPIAATLTLVGLFNDKAKRLAIHLVGWTGKSRQKIHPKNLLADVSAYAWYRRFLKPTDRVLDIGAGTGSHTFIAAECCQDVVGIEYDPKNLTTCIRRRDERGLKNVEFLNGNAEERLPFEDQHFDVVMLLDVLEHLNQRDAALQEVRRVLKPGGRLLVAIPNRQTSWKRALLRAGLFPYSDRDHKIEYSQAEITDELTRNGFGVEQPFETIVVDTPLVGLIDIVGGISLSLYRKLMQWKVRYAAEHPEESIGWQIVARRT
jgi:glycosyltransferase involved in cell wall biosynthesis/SAM-dependent methyltransferase